MTAHPRHKAARILLLLFIGWLLLAVTCEENPGRRNDIARICGDPAANCGCWAQYGYDTCR